MGIITRFRYSQLLFQKRNVIGKNQTVFAAGYFGFQEQRFTAGLYGYKACADYPASPAV